MAEEAPPEGPVPDQEMPTHRLQHVTVFLPGGGIVIPGDRVSFGQTPTGETYVDAMQSDGSCERFVGCGFAMKMASTRLVQPVTAKIVT